MSRIPSLVVLILSIGMTGRAEASELRWPWQEELRARYGVTSASDTRPCPRRSMPEPERACAQFFEGRNQTRSASPCCTRVGAKMRSCWTNDKARSMVVWGPPETVIRVYDSPTASHGDDYFVLRKGDAKPVCVPTLEAGQPPYGGASKYYYSGGNGLDGKVSTARLTSGPEPTDPNVVTDQANTTSHGYLVLDQQQWAKQTFEVSQAGKLMGIEVALRRCQAADTATVTLEVGDESTSFGSVSKTATDVAPQPETADECHEYPEPLSATVEGPGYFDLSSLDQTLVPGQQYHFKLATTGYGLYGFHFGFSTDPYANGECILTGETFPWDLAFKVVIRLSP